VRVANTTSMPSLPIGVGAPIMVTGRTDAQGFLVAESIETVAPGSIVPDIEDDDGGEDEHDGDEDSGSSSSNDAGAPVAKETALSISKVEGLVQLVSGKIWLINNQRVDVSSVLSSGDVAPGSSVIVEGYYSSDGTFVAVKITFVNTPGESGSGSAGGNGNEGLNANDDDSNDNDDNDNSDDGNDNGSGDDGNDNGGGGNDND